MLHKEPPSPSGVPGSSDGLTFLVISKEKKNKWVGGKEVQWWMRGHHFAPIVLHYFASQTQFAKTQFVFCIGRFPCCVLLTNENPGTDKLSR